MTAGAGSNDPSSFGWANYGGPNAIGIVPYSFGGVSFPAGIADILRQQADYLLMHIVPMINGGLDTTDYGNGLTGNYGFEDRGIVQDPSTRSFHSYGIAIDVNAVQNGQGASYGNGYHQIPAAAGAFAASLGWLCGGDFNGLTDPMHFECHNSPAEILAWNAAHSVTPTNPVTPPPTITPDLWEQIMSMTGAPGTYKQFLSDVATAVANEMAQLQSAEQRNPGGLTVGIDDAANAVNHGENWDHSIPSVTS